MSKIVDQYPFKVEFTKTIAQGTLKNMNFNESMGFCSVKEAEKWIQDIKAWKNPIWTISNERIVKN